MNSDTPSGEAEATLLNQILQQEELLNPNEAFENTFCEAVLQCYQKNCARCEAIPNRCNRLSQPICPKIYR
jgi:hypothetical protein